MMNDVTVMFAPLNGEPYYLYQRKDGSKFMSLIAPKEWQYNYYKLKFLGTYKCQDNEWTKE